MTLKNIKSLIPKRFRSVLEEGIAMEGFGGLTFEKSNFDSKDGLIRVIVWDNIYGDKRIWDIFEWRNKDSSKLIEKLNLT
jgi:hypothetical protein